MRTPPSSPQGGFELKSFAVAPYGQAGVVYVAFIVDCYAQRIVAWHASTSKLTDLVTTPLRMALWHRGGDGHPVTGGQLVHHSDAGSQYTSIKFTDHLSLEGIAPSIGSVGDAYDNALMENRDRPVQDRMPPHSGLPPRALQDHRRHRVRHRQLGRLIQQPPTPLDPRDGPTSRTRTGLLRCPQHRAAARMSAARNPGRFRHPSGSCFRQSRGRASEHEPGQHIRLEFLDLLRARRRPHLTQITHHRQLPPPRPLTFSPVTRTATPLTTAQAR